MYEGRRGPYLFYIENRNSNKISWRNKMASEDLCGKLELDVDIKATCEQFHNMFKHKPHHIHSTTENVHGCELHDGEWGTVGAVIEWNYFHGK